MTEPADAGRRKPQTLRIRQTVEHREVSASGETEIHTGEIVRERHRADAGRPARLDQPEPTRHLGREVHADRDAVGERPGDRGGDRGRAVHHDDIPALQRLRQVSEGPVHDFVLAVRNEEPNVATPAAPSLRRFVRLERGIEGGNQCGALQYGGHDTSSGTRYRPPG